MTKANAKKKAQERWIYTQMKPDQLNLFLWKHYGHGLYSFVFSLAEAIYHTPIFGFDHIWKIKNVTSLKYKKYYEEIEKLNDIRRKTTKIVKSLKFHFRELPNWHTHHIPSKNKMADELFRNIGNYKNTDFETNVIIESYKLAGFIKFLDEEINYLKNCVLCNYQKRPGMAVQPSIIVHALWSLVMKKNGRTDMKNVKILVKWFADKLENTSYKNLLRCQFRDSQIYRSRQDHEQLYTEAQKFYFPKTPPKFYAKGMRPSFFRFDYSHSQLRVSSIRFKCSEVTVPVAIFPDGSKLEHNFSRIPKKYRMKPD